jgi:hypothetical protein
MKYAVQMGSGAMTYIPSFIKTGSGIQKFIEGIHRYTDSMMIAYDYIYLFLNKESRLKIAVSLKYPLDRRYGRQKRSGRCGGKMFLSSSIS